MPARVGNEEVIDFTSSLYLGFKHPSWEIGSWNSITTGKPAALFERPIDKMVGHSWSRLQGFEAGVISKSTQLLFWDVINLLSQKRRILIYKDLSIYPVVKAGLASAAHNGAHIYSFKPGDLRGLKNLIRSTLKVGFQPVILSEGWLVEKGCVAPLNGYYYLVRTYGGYLVVDDTQALGVLGKNPSRSNPYGHFGGGTFQYLGMKCSAERIISISSMAKGFGVPVAIMSSNYNWIKAFLRLSQTRVHNSSPGAAEVLAAQNARKQNRAMGESRRRHLLKNIFYFKETLRETSVDLEEHFFPVQILKNHSADYLVRLYHSLTKLGFKVLLLRKYANRSPVIGVCISSAHTTNQITRLSEAIIGFTKSHYQKV